MRGITPVPLVPQAAVAADLPIAWQLRVDVLVPRCDELAHPSRGGLKLQLRLGAHKICCQVLPQRHLASSNLDIAMRCATARRNVADHFKVAEVRPCLERLFVRLLVHLLVGLFLRCNGAWYQDIHNCLGLNL
jgi:hypothetical protein